ncbi:MAG TPA: type I DNA topoisomerase [Phycisphaerae bacterium]|nr:type I DNA topoisomerase [Phycisphaerae bacterium]
MAKKTRTIKKTTGGATEAGGKPLVIVESPAKAKTINKYLGSGYVVKASRGHVRDLPQRRYGIDPGRNFEPNYEILASHRKIIDELAKLAEAAPVVYLATDLDREGEAIAWHLSHALDLPPGKIRRVVFNEITKSAITEAFRHPHGIDMAKVDAQQARRILDRVVGYELSPLLWKKVAKGLSAGRVQSVAVRMIVDREAEIVAFEPQEYWVVDGVFTPDVGRAAELAGQWREFLAAGEKGGVAQTNKDRGAWLSERGCFEASLAEVSGKPFRPEGRLDRKKPEAPEFVSAVEEVRPVAESLGFRIARVDTAPWKEYSHLGLSRVTLTGATEVAAEPRFTVKSVETKRMRSKPSPPFTTATLQQAAANQLRFPTSKTMKVAQSLYEGVDIKTGEGNVGLITYMRTDSTNLSAESVQAVRQMIKEAWGEKYLPGKPVHYASGKQAQEAHEAVRPTDVRRTPESLRGHLTPEQHRLYALIWNRFVACQMSEAAWDSTAALISAKVKQGEAVFKAAGRVLVFDGFYKVMGVPKNGDSQTLPPLRAGQQVMPLALTPEQKFTSPPARYTEASLVKALEAEGIGRPSTYATIIKTIQDRGYVEQEDRKFHPTARGELVTGKLVAHFPKIMDLRFTGHVEDDLDKIEEKHIDWHDVLHEFYDPFKESLARAHEEMEAVRAEPSPYTCELCHRPMVYRHGRKGRFLACSGYPECTSAKDVDREGKIIEMPKVSETCDLCGRPMVMRRSRSGPFLGCSGYPDCTNTKPCGDDGVALKKVKAEDIKQSCPECGSPMQVKFSRGRSFLGCTKYPACKATAQMPPGIYVEKPKPAAAGVRCDKCGRDMVIRKSRRGPFLSCSGFPRCRNAMPMDKLDHLKSLEAAGQIPQPRPENGKNGSTNGGKNGGAKSKTRGKAKSLTKEEVAGLGPPPAGFAWTRTGRPVVETWPVEPLHCYECGSEMTLRTGRFGPFYSCPSCKAAANLRGDAKKQAEAQMPAPAKPEPIDTDLKCPDCGAKMVLRMGRTGRFLGCVNYPKCKKTMEAPPGLLREVAEATA